MPLVTNVIDDKSPLILCDSTWLGGTAQYDNFAVDYYPGTFTTNNVTDRQVSFNFNGTAVSIYGANRPNHGSYNVQVDSATYQGFNGAANNLFQVSLFNISSLSQGTHTIKLTNTASGSLCVDVDMIVWQSQVGNTSDQLVQEIVQDTDLRFQYQEPAWSTTSGSINFALFNNGTDHLTQTYDASVIFTFTVSFLIKADIKDLMCHAGHACYSVHRHASLTKLSGEVISLYGTSGPDNGPYSIRLDGGQTVQYNASNVYPTNYGLMIYHADNLGPGSHQLVLTNLPVASGQSLCIDYAQLWTIANTTSIGTPLPNTSSSDVSQKLSAGAIAGIVVAIAVALLSTGAAVFFYRRWKAAVATQKDLYRAIAPQQPASVVVTPTGFSSSLETRTNTTGSLLRNDISPLALPGGVQRLAHGHATQYGVPAYLPTTTGSRDLRSGDTVSLPTQSAVDEDLGQRPLPEVPGGALSLSEEFPKLASSRRRQSITTVDHGSIAVSEILPNYIQATRNEATTHR